MSISSFRLPHKADRLYSGQMLDRSRTLRFMLDGVGYDGFEGDTVLSAVLANGADQFGYYRGQPVGLDERLHPPVTFVGMEGNPTAALAMCRTPAINGMELVSLAKVDAQSTGAHRRLKRQWDQFRGRAPTSLSLDPESISPFPGPWAELDPEAHLTADLIVVGAGAGGLSAARAGAERGWSVILVEQLGALGGDASFFGSEEGEGRAEDLIEKLTDDVLSTPLVTVLTDTEVLGVSAGTLRAHQTLTEDQRPRTRVIGLRGNHMVLAQGAHERLPLFAGNRLPGVSGARAAHRMAGNFGVWRGNTAIINTASSAATQVALQAADMGVGILRLTDSRSDPQSRFFDFAKAYGVSLATGLRVAEVELAANRQVEVSFELAGSGKAGTEDSQIADRLLICGGWQPDLTLWNMAGGKAEWDEQRQHLRPVGQIENVALAGWCDGALSLTDCVSSGENAVLRLSGAKAVKPKSDEVKSRLESDDGQLPVSRPANDDASCFLDNGYSFSTLLPDAGAAGLLKSALGMGPREEEPELRALSLNDVSAKVLLGQIDPEIAGEFARERCVVPGQIDTGRQAPSSHPEVGDAPNEDVPAFLLGRFGPNAGVIHLRSTGGQGVEAGSLLFQTSNETAPEQSLGVVLHQPRSNAGDLGAYVDLNRVNSGKRLLARAGNRTVELLISDSVGAA